MPGFGEAFAARGRHPRHPPHRRDADHWWLDGGDAGRERRDPRRRRALPPPDRRLWVAAWAPMARCCHAEARSARTPSSRSRRSLSPMTRRSRPSTRWRARTCRGSILPEDDASRRGLPRDAGPSSSPSTPLAPGRRACRADRRRPCRAGRTPLPVPFAGHPCGLLLAEAGLLADLARAVILGQGDALPGFRARVRAARAGLPRYWRGLAERALGGGRPALAVAAARRGVDLAPGSAGRPRHARPRPVARRRA